MARKRRKKGHKKGHSGLRAQYAAAKRAYHAAGDRLYRSGHGGRSIHSHKRRKRRKTRHKRSR